MKFIIEHLSKRFEQKEVLKDIDFTFEASMASWSGNATGSNPSSEWKDTTWFVQLIQSNWGAWAPASSSILVILLFPLVSHTA